MAEFGPVGDVAAHRYALVPMPRPGSGCGSAVSSDAGDLVAVDDNLDALTPEVAVPLRHLGQREVADRDDIVRSGDEAVEDLADAQTVRDFDPSTAHS